MFSLFRHSSFLSNLIVLWAEVVYDKNQSIAIQYPNNKTDCRETIRFRMSILSFRVIGYTPSIQMHEYILTDIFSIVCRKLLLVFHKQRDKHHTNVGLPSVYIILILSRHKRCTSIVFQFSQQFCVCVELSKI